MSVVLAILLAADWYGIHLQGSKIGYLVVKRNSIVSERMYMKIKAIGGVKEVRTYLDWKPKGDDSVESFKFLMETEDSKTSVEGRISRGELKYTVKTSVSERTERRKLKRNLYVGSSINSLFRKLIKGDGEENVMFFDPSVLALGNLRLKYLGRKGEFFIIEKEFGGVRSILFADEKFNLVKEELPMGIVFLKEPKEEATAHISGDTDIILASAVPAMGKIITSRGLKLIKVRIEGDVEVPRSPRQRVRRGKGWTEVEVRIEPEGFFKGRKEAYEYLKSTPLVQSDDPKIVAIARSIVKGAKTREDAIKKLVEWVYKNIKKETSFSMPSALDVLATKRGDCNEHTILFTALARAVRIPTKIVFGVVHDSGYFFYHAWAEVLLKEWVQVDPSWGQVPADATHVKLGEGGPEKWIEILSYVGRMKIKVLDAR